MRSFVSGKSYVAAAIFLVIFAWIADNSIEKKSAAFDEAAHITAGYSYWITGDFRLNPQNGVFPQAWAALPLLAQGLTFPSTNQQAWQQRDIWKIGDQFFHSSGNDHLQMLRLSRRMIILLGVITGLVIFLWSKKLWGNSGALLSLGLFILSPTILAHTRLATSDMAAALSFLLATGSTWRLSHHISFANLLLTSLAFALLALSKMSVVLMIPISFTLLVVRYFSTQPVQIAFLKTDAASAIRLVIYNASLVLICVIVITIINIAHISHYPDPDIFDWRIIEQLPWAMQSPLYWLHSSGLFPDSFLYGLSHTLVRTGDRLSFVAGNFSLQGWWWFFPFAFLVKTPLTTLFVISLSCWQILTRLRAPSEKPDSLHTLYHCTPLLTLVCVYSAFAIQSHLNIGHRHLLPIYPPLFILCGIIASQVVKRRRTYVFITYLLLASESLAVHPHYLTFFNHAAGGPKHGYRLLVDSSLDWGQDLPLLAEWLKENSSKPVYLGYFGTARPEQYGIHVKHLPGFLDRDHTPDPDHLEPGTYIISASLLQLGFLPPEFYGPWTAEQEQQYRTLINLYATPDNKAALKTGPSYQRYERLRFGRLCDYLKTREPDGQLGYSLLVYNLKAIDLQNALHIPLTDNERNNQ